MYISKLTMRHGVSHLLSILIMLLMSVTSHFQSVSVCTALRSSLKSTYLSSACTYESFTGRLSPSFIPPLSDSLIRVKVMVFIIKAKLRS